MRYSPIFHCPYRNPQDNSQTGYACKTIAGTGLKASGGCCRIITEQARNLLKTAGLFFPSGLPGIGSPAGVPCHVGVGGSCIWRTSRREAPTVLQWELRSTSTNALHSALIPNYYGKNGLWMPNAGHLPLNVSALFKGGGPLRLRNGGGLAAPWAAFPFRSICPWQMVSFCRNGMTGRHGCAGLGHPLRFRYRQAVHFAGSPAWSPYGIAMSRRNFVHSAGQPACAPYGIAMDLSPLPYLSSLFTLPSALYT